MFTKRMSELTSRAKQELERLRERERATTEHLVEVLSDVLQVTTETQDPASSNRQIREVLEREGGAAHLLEQCEDGAQPTMATAISRLSGGITPRTARRSSSLPDTFR